LLPAVLHDIATEETTLSLGGLYQQPLKHPSQELKFDILEECGTALSRSQSTYPPVALPPEVSVNDNACQALSRHRPISLSAESRTPSWIHPLNSKSFPRGIQCSLQDLPWLHLVGRATQDCSHHRLDIQRYILGDLEWSASLLSENELHIRLFAYSGSGNLSLDHLSGVTSDSRSTQSRYIANFIMRSRRQMPDDMDRSFCRSMAEILAPSTIDPTEQVFQITAYFSSNNMLSRSQLMSFFRDVVRRCRLESLISFLQRGTHTTKAFTDRLVEAAIFAGERSFILSLMEAGVHILGYIAAPYLNPSSVFLSRWLADDEFFSALEQNARAARLSSRKAISLLSNLISSNALSLTRTLIDWGFSIPLNGDGGFAPLSSAVRLGHSEMVKILLDCGADANRHYFNRTALGYALQNTAVDMSVVQALLRHGAEFPWLGMTREEAADELLHLDGVSPSVIRILGVDDLFEDQHLVLLGALRTNSHIEAKAILQDMTISTLRSPAILDAMFLAALKTDNPDELCSLLLQAGATITNAIVLERAVFCSNSTLKVLVQRGCGAGKFVAQALVAACVAKRFASVAFLIQNGANPNEPAPSGITPLQAAYTVPMLDGDPGDLQHTPLFYSVTQPLVEYLVDQGADINASGSTNGGLPVFQEACRRWDIGMIMLLRRSSSDVVTAATSSSSLGPLEALSAGPMVSDHHCGSTGTESAIFENIFLEFLAHGASFPSASWRRQILLCNLVRLEWRTALERALNIPQSKLEMDQPEMNEADMEWLYNLRFGNAYAWLSPMQTAVRNADWDVLDLLLHSGEAVNSSPMGMRGRTPLQEATEHRYKSIELVEWLLDHGADVNAPPAARCGITALQGAAISGNLKLAMMLIARGAKVNAEPSPQAGRYAIEGAAENGRLDMVQLLLNAGAIGNPSNEKRPLARAIELAEEDNHFGVADLLRSAEQRISWENLARV